MGYSHSMKIEVKNEICKKCQVNFEITSDDFSFYEKMSVPAPKECPLCRQQRRMLFRNFKTLYKIPSALSGKMMISMYAENTPYKIYTRDEWWSDDFDALAYGRDFDFSCPFFEQFAELLLDVPKFSLMSTQCSDCDYANFAIGSKNCYLIFGAVEDEDCAYGHIVWESKDSVDNLYLYKSDLCYECTDCIGSYKLLYCQESENCASSIGLFDCRGCTDCIGCVGLNQKSNYIFNQQVSKEEYKKFLEDHPLTDLENIEFILSEREKLRKSLPQRSFFGSHNIDVSGNHVYNAHNVHYSFDVKGGENSKFVFTSRKSIDCYDIGFSPDLEASYYALTCVNGNNIRFSHLCNNSTYADYSDACFNMHNIFGCAGLKGGEYMILNKQYSKEEYFALKEKIIEHMKKTGEWGDFFSADLSPFCYNESIAGEYMPLSKEKALAQGFRWKDDLPGTFGQETIKTENLPKDPNDFSNDLTKEVLKCAQCNKNYKLVDKEISFYKKIGLPIPQKCFNCRHASRMQKRNPRTLWSCMCANCGNEIKTSYPPEKQSEYKIYCESCYQQEML